MVFFLDRGLGFHLIAEAIRARGYEALPMADAYPDGTDQRISDPEWITRADTEGWVALTKDPSIIRDHRDVPAETRLRIFAFNLRVQQCEPDRTEMVARLDANLNRILQRARKPGPHLWMITPDGLQLRWPKA
ncbi:MAG: hypothetical protein F4076_10915 [Acidimicrobiaceae bacterium]|nr:hypothetical protein [Acidimicrobiaceae bacterium]